MAELVQLVKLELDPSKKHRRLEVAKGGGFSSVKMIDTMRVPIAFEEVGEATVNGKKARTYKIKPVEPLPPGEYAIVISSKAYWDFAIE